MIEENQTSIQIQTTPPEATINSNTSTIQIPSIPDVNPRKSKRKPRRKSNINPSASKTKEKIEENLPNETQIIETIIETLHPDILCLKNNLKVYINELKTMLAEGLDQYTISISEEFLEKLKIEFQETSDEEQLKVLLEKLLVPIIDSKPYNKLSELAVTCKEYAGSFTNKFHSWDDQKFIDFIMSISERKNYLDRIKINFAPEEINNHQFYIFEIKNTDNLTYYANMLEVQNAKKKRVHKMKIAENLYRLIQSIEKAKTIEDLDKTNKALDAYYKKKQEKLKLIENKPLISERKRKIPYIKDSTESKEGTVKKTLKKLKLDSDKESFISTKEHLSDSEINIEKEKTNSNEDLNHKENENEKSSKQKKQNNQKSLLSFFAKKSPRKSDIKLQLKESKPLFRCIGFSSQNSYQQKFQNEYLNYFDSFLQKINSTEIIPIEILSFLKNETLQIKISQRRPIQSQKRKISLFFSDSLRKYNGVLCELVAKRVKGRKPLEKEDFINYEIDSDEEIEEQNATDISSDEKEIEEEDDDSEEEDEKFVVPDGYLSQEEKLDEDGDPEINRAVLNNQQNTNIQTNKAFLFSLDKYQQGKDSNLDEFVGNFKVFQICSEEYPITLKKNKKNENNLKGEDLWTNEEIFKAFIRFLHGSYENKPSIVTEFISRNQNLTKASIKRKIDEISKKDKLEGQTRARYLVNKELFETMKMEEEYEIILKEKFELNAKKEESEMKAEQNDKKEEENLKKFEEEEEKEITTICATDKKIKKKTTPNKLQQINNNNPISNSSNSKSQKNIMYFMKSPINNLPKKNKK